MDEKMLLQAIQEIVKAEIEPLNERMGGMEQRMGGVEQRMDRFEILLEHDIPKQLQLLAEGHQGIVKRLPKEHELDGIRSRVSTLERVVADHS